MQEIDLRRIDLNLLVVFDVLMAERSVTRAAARLARTQSAVSHALARLREQVGDPLLVKVGGRMSASPRAESLAEDVRLMLHGVRRMLAAPTAFVAASSERTFRVAIPDLTMALFARLTVAVQREAPGVTMEWVPRDDNTSLAVAEGRVDIAHMPTAIAMPDGIEAESAGSFRWATFARRGHPAVKSFGAAAWRRYAHVAVRVDTKIPSPVASAAGKYARRRVSVWVPHFSAVAPLLAHPDLLATLPLIAMVDSMERYDLVALRPPFPIPPMPHRLIWSRRLAGEPGLAWLRAHLRQTLQAVLVEGEAAILGRASADAAAGARRVRSRRDAP